VFNNVTVKGFDYFIWNRSDPEGFQKALASVVELIKDKKINLSAKVFNLNDYLAAIAQVGASGSGAAIIKF
jgi:NADPH:quinone reductase-like Zn-dependent oxidoreductase